MAFTNGLLCAIVVYLFFILKKLNEIKKAPSEDASRKRGE